MEHDQRYNCSHPLIMQLGKASRTAWAAAAYRAAHQILEQGSIFADPLASASWVRTPRPSLARLRSIPPDKGCGFLSP